MTMALGVASSVDWAVFFAAPEMGFGRAFVFAGKPFLSLVCCRVCLSLVAG